MSRKWISFFTDAGIPSTAAATYALIFSENRISEDMLLDLDREVLKEMGIQTMGDVISILKHARYVYEKTARDTVLQSSSKDKTEKPVKKTLVSTVSVPENDPYFYSPSSELKKATEEKKALRKEGPVLPPNMKLSSKVSSTSSKHQNSDSGSSEKSSKGKKILKRKIKTSVQKGVIVKEETDDSDSSSSSSSSSSLECVSKYRKVLPEPSSKTASSSVRSSPSRSKPFSFSGTKRTVSILDKEPEIIPKSGTTFTITMGGASAKTADATKKSIFSRLDSKVGSGTSDRGVPQVELDLTNVHEEKLPYEDNGLQPTVEIINDLYTPLVEPYVKSDGRVLLEPVARVKPIIQTEGILANPLSKPKVGPKERLGVTSPSASVFRSQPSSNLYEPPYNPVNSYLSQPDGMRSTQEVILDDDVFYTNGTHSKKVNFSEILQKKVSIPSMDCEIMEKPSVKNRITLSQPGFRSGEAKIAGLKPLFTPKERITMNPIPSTGRSVGSANMAPVRNRIALKSSVRDRISLKSPAPIRERISLKSAPSIRERIGEKPVPLVRERISLKPTASVRERISLKPTASVRERISLKPTTSFRENPSLKSTPSVRERISLKSVTPARERISIKSSGSVRERISLNPSSAISLSTNARMNKSNVSLKTPLKDRIAHKGVPVRARLGKLANINAAKKLNAAKQASKASSVFSRLG